MENKQIAATFYSLADILEIKGEDAFRVNAYRRAARVIEDLATDIAVLAEAGELTTLPGVGAGTAGRIEEYLRTGKMQDHEEQRKTLPKGLLELLEVPGLGPKTIGLVWKSLGVKSLAGLKRALRGGKILDLPGMGKKRVENIQAAVRAYESRSGRLTLGAVLPTAEAVLAELREATGIDGAALAGSVRRFRETIGDVDVLVASAAPAPVIAAFTTLECVAEVLAAGTTKASVRTVDALQVDMRVVEPDSWGAALMYFTGSQAHNVRLRGLAQSLGMKLNEYGLFKGERRVAGRTEEAVFQKLGLPYIEPELREDRGEVEAALDGRLPALIEPSDIKGDLHVHSNWSDGHSSIEEMARAAKRRGHRYVSINDHTRSLGIAHGLSVDRLEAQMEEIDAVNKGISGFRVLKGTEVDILSDGTLDLPDELLERLDVVVASIHSGFGQPEDRITGRMLSAIENPHVDVIGHPTGRLLGTRDPYAVDLERVMARAAETGTALEMNAWHERLDLNDVNSRRAAEIGVPLAISTDAHHPDHLDLMELGVRTARRGWLEPSSVLNTLSAGALLRRLRSD